MRAWFIAVAILLSTCIGADTILGNGGLVPGTALGANGISGDGGTVAPTTEPAIIGFATLWNDNTSTDATSYSTGSVTPPANALLVATVRNFKATTPDLPTMTGNGLTWVQISTTLYGTTGTPTMRITVFRAMGAAPSTGAITMSYGGNTQTGTIYEIGQWTNVDTTGTNGSGAIVQAPTPTTGDSTANPTITYTTPSSGSNALIFAYGDDVNASDATMPQGWQEEDELAIATPAAGGSMGYQLNAVAGTSITATCTARNWAAVMLEIKAGTKPIGQIQADWFADLHSQSNGATMTGAIFDAGRYGTGSTNWGISGGGTAAKFTVAATFSTRLHDVLCAGVTYTPTGVVSHSFNLDTTAGQIYLSGNPVAVSGINKRRWISTGGSISINMTGGSGLYDIMRLDYGLAGVLAVMQYRPGQGLNIEQTSGGTTHSTNIAINETGTVYFWSLAASMSTQVAALKVWDTAGNVIAGGSVTLAIGAGSANDYWGAIKFANVEFGSSTGTIKLENVWGNNSGVLQGP